MRTLLVSDGEKANTGDMERLVKASQAGDRGAFDVLVRLCQRRAMQVAVRVLGSADEAAEAVQTGFVKAYLGIGKLREPKRFEVWLLRIIANAAVSQARTAKRRAEKIKVADDYEDKKTLPPVETKSAEELKEAIQRAMSNLSKKEAKAISLFGLKDLSHREVAEIMGCSVNAVKWHVFKARQKLKVLLREYLE
jgi:RNA polymerase sigma-70 factor (ECF subfamily)